MTTTTARRRRRAVVVVNQSSFETRHISNISGGRRKRGRENVVDGCALSAPSCTTRGARRPRAPPSACYRHRKLMRRVDAPTITTTAPRRRRDHDDAIFPKLKFLRDAESAREQEPGGAVDGVAREANFRARARARALSRNGHALRGARAVSDRRLQHGKKSHRAGTSEGRRGSTT